MIIRPCLKQIQLPKSTTPKKSRKHVKTPNSSKAVYTTPTKSQVTELAKTPMKSQNIFGGTEDKSKSDTEKCRKENKKSKKRKKQDGKEDTEIFIIESLVEKKGDNYL